MLTRMALPTHTHRTFLIKRHIPTYTTNHRTQTITRAGGDKVREDYTPEEVIVDARLEYTGPEFMEDLQRLLRDATKGAGEVAEMEEGKEGDGEGERDG